MSASSILESIRRRTWTLLFILAVLIALAIAGWRTLQGPTITAWTVGKVNLVQTVVASGRVETPLRVDVGSQLTATVADVPVAQGQAVSKGQLLIGLENSEQRAALEQARAGVSQAQARLAQLDKLALPTARQSLNQADINLQNTRRQYERTRQLREKNFVGQAALDDARRSLDIAESQLQSTRLQVQSNDSGGADRQLARAALEQANATMSAAQARLALTRIAAPHDGVLISRNVERGDVVQPGKILMVLSPAGPTQLVLQIDERNLAQLRIGQQALASADAFPNERFPARIVYINPGIDAQRGSVEVRLDVGAPPAYLRQDMTVSVDTEIARRGMVLAVPADAVRDANSATPWVMKVQDGRATRAHLRLGLRGTGQIEVLDGLREGDLVLPATEDVAVGKRLRAQPVSRDRASK
ncbi:efflux RND transporter periplasmic adaptor subunit [Lacisediminimonas sp.]|uniref:efflux RND transporter periplasmic adaptor subunit n=1 Tax=Lacisediminimonas sp. TaxID=3060582 RepID=UPI00271FD638|nr:efflux RND transporter periplasmic adaptor subunit [Lacisediminimonas sp.]MDO8300761.1 efflux RND transporter periplasmic adaptor subunit [Lacisediminimonas sp.]